MNYTLPLKVLESMTYHWLEKCLGEMIQNLTALGVNIPDGFVVTVDAYYAYIKHNMLDQN
jgi:phosphoenolpyruvate synthase/pyruvate phosphate dikinase